MNIPIEYLKNLGITLSPPPLAAFFETVASCKSADDLEKNFASIKADAQKYIDETAKSLPVIPMEIEMCLSSLIVLNFVEAIDTDDIKKIEEEIDDRLEFWNETTVYPECVIVQLASQIEKSSVIEDFVDPIKEILKEDGIKVKSIVFI